MILLLGLMVSPPGASRAGELRVNGFAAYAGSFGLQLVNDGVITYVQDDSPLGETRYRARFYLQPRFFNVGIDPVDLFVGFSNDGQPQLKVRVLLNAALSERRLVVSARTDAGTMVETSGLDQILLHPVWNSVEIDWKTADVGQSNGYLDVWLNGRLLPLSGVSGLDNDTGRIDFVRWGYLGGGGLSGSLVLDDFASQRASFLGPVSAFEDVTDTTFWAWPFIHAMYGASLVDGCASSPRLFCPDIKVSRAQIAKFVIASREGIGYRPPAATGTVFNDVPAGFWAAPWIEQAEREGVMTGCGGGNFCPDDLVSRGEMAVIILKAREGASFVPPPATGKVFVDVPASDPEAPWIELLAEERLVNGCVKDPPKYCPDLSINRAQMAKFMVLTFELPVIPARP